MKKVRTLIGLGILSIALISFTGNHECEKDEKVNFETVHKTFAQSMILDLAIAEIDIEDIIVLEEEEVIDLGFDTTEYLPVGFNAYEGMDFKLDEIAYLEEEEVIDLGFDTAAYLPADFDPYQTAELDLNEIIFLEEEEEIVLDFNVEDYLPANFDASAK